MTEFWESCVLVDMRTCKNLLCTLVIKLKQETLSCLFLADDSFSLAAYLGRSEFAGYWSLIDIMGKAKVGN